MSIEPKIMSYLKANVPAVNERIHFVKAIQGTAFPYIVLSKVSEQKDYSHDGASGLARPRFQVSVFGDAYVGTKLAAVEVKEAMDSWNADGIKFAPLQNEIDLYEEDTGLYHVPLDFFLYYQD